MMLFLLAMSAGPAMATTGGAPKEAPVVQQSETCTGVVKGTTNGTITDFDGNFSLGNVKKGDVIQKYTEKVPSPFGVRSFTVVTFFKCSDKIFRCFSLLYSGEVFIFAEI